ncbi:aspartic peptidase A1 [Phlebopus sp. FC_14]|nr:aspartic peptidase A1 [Phlebopus sp. FC_14]
MVTMPLRRFHVPRTDVHPQLHLQQNINRASKRLARMTGRAEPLEHELRAELSKRMYLLESGPGSRIALPGSDVTQGSNFSRRCLGSGMAAAVGHQKGKGVAATNAGNGTTPANATVGASGAAGNSTGVSPLDSQAATNGGLTAANNPSANNSLGLAIEADDVAYIASVQIGTPPQNFNILMDSGSADFWVGAENCQSQQGGCGNHTFLGTQSSSSFVQNNTQFQVTYGSGAVAGQLCQDNVVMAGLALNNHSFGVATQESVQFASSSVPFDGLMGLAKSTLSQQKVQTPVEALAANGLISSAITSFKISRLADQLNDGEITFGGLDSTKFDANTLATFPNVNAQGFWEGAVDAITVNGADTGLTGRTAILDTGTTLILAPPSDAQAIIQGMGGTCDQQQCTVPCTGNASLALSFGNASFAIDPRDMAVLPVNPNDPTGDCTAGIQPGQIGAATEWLVGDVFLKNAYFSVDVNKNQISLAKLSTVS